MERKTDRLCPSAPLEKDDLEQILGKNVNSFNTSNSNIKEKVVYFKDRNHKSKKKLKNYKTLTTIIESVDTVVEIGATSASITLSITCVGLIISPKPAGIASTLSLGNRALHKMKLKKYNKYKKNMKKINILLSLLIKYAAKFYKVM